MCLDFGLRAGPYSNGSTGWWWRLCISRARRKNLRVYFLKLVQGTFLKWKKKFNQEQSYILEEGFLIWNVHLWYIYIFLNPRPQATIAEKGPIHVIRHKPNSPARGRTFPWLPHSFLFPLWEVQGLHYCLFPFTANSPVGITYLSQV